MKSRTPDPALIKKIEKYQKAEITEYYIYGQLAASMADPHNSGILAKMAEEERIHYNIWKEYTGKDISPDRFRIWLYYCMARILGLTFTVKLMEKRENEAISSYGSLLQVIPEAETILRKEEEHEMEILGLLDEKGLRYVGSVVLGLNDALVEFTGSLAGFTFALQDSRIIAMAGFIMGIAASLSMGASEYLSRKSENAEGSPVTAATYTTIAYIGTVIILILPFLLIPNPFIAMAFTLAGAIIVIVFFTFYTSVARDLPFWKRFTEMALLSLGIAAISLLIGMLVRTFLGV